MAERPPDIQVKRAYDPPDDADGARVLVDRLWPRGLRKDDARLTLWLREVAPSGALRAWFGHDPARWHEFVRRYRAEIARNPDAVARLADLAQSGRLTLLYGARDSLHNQAVALASYLREKPGAAPQRTRKPSRVRASSSRRAGNRRSSRS